MPKQAWSQGLARQTTAGTLFNTFTTAKSVINSESILGIPGNSLTLGDSYVITVDGAVSNIVTTPGTMVFQVMIGPSVPVSTIAWTSGNIQLNATAHTTVPFRLVVNIDFQVLNVKVGGAVAQFIGMGWLTGRPFTLVAGATDATEPTVGNFMCPVTAPALSTAIDSTVSNVIDFFVGFSISNAGNGVQIWSYRVDGTN